MSSWTNGVCNKNRTYSSQNALILARYQHIHIWKLSQTPWREVYQPRCILELSFCSPRSLSHKPKGYFCLFCRSYSAGVSYIAEPFSKLIAAIMQHGADNGTRTRKTTLEGLDVTVTLYLHIDNVGIANPLLPTHTLSSTWLLLSPYWWGSEDLPLDNVG